MKKTITRFLNAALLLAAVQISNAQTSIADFENLATSPNSAYTSTTSTPFQTSNAIFPYKWDNTFSYWAGGFSYTNKYDSSTATASNLYGVKAYKGYNNSNVYTVGQDRGTITLKFPYNSADGFYITNTTYAYKAMRNGNSFARKFGDTTGTGSGTTIPQGSYPDYFKITVKGFFSGAMKNDSVQFYLADYRSANNNLDYVVNNWQWLNTSTLGQVDSIKFFMYSSDVGQFGINTPLFFAIDNFTTSSPFVGLTKHQSSNATEVYPNPFTNTVYFNTDETANLVIKDITGKTVYTASLEIGKNEIDLQLLESGIYFAETSSASGTTIKKLIKH